MRKEDLRRQIQQIKRQFTPQQLEELSLPVISRLKPLLADAQTIMAYYSLPDEVNTHGLIDELVAEGKTVLLPKVTGTDTMELRRYTGRADLQEGTYHIHDLKDKAEKSEIELKKVNDQLDENNKKIEELKDEIKELKKIIEKNN